MMSSDSTVVIISICGIAAVVAIVIFLAAFLVVRIFKTSVFSMAMMAMKIIAEPKDESTVESVRAQSIARPKRDLHAQAKSLDFDSAVARQVVNKPAESPVTKLPPTPTASAQVVPPPGFETPATKQYPSLNKRRLTQRAEEGEDMDLLDAFGDDD